MYQQYALWPFYFDLEVGNILFGYVSCYFISFQLWPTDRQTNVQKFQASITQPELNTESFTTLTIHSSFKNKHDKSSRSPGLSYKFVAEAKLHNLLYFVYTLPAVCTVQLINTWRQAGLDRGFVDYSEKGGTHRQIHTHTHKRVPIILLQHHSF